MKIELNELTKDELYEMINLYIGEREWMPWLCSIEEFCKYHVRKCEGCGEYIVIDGSDELLPIATNWRGNKYHVCEKCLEEMENDE